MKENNLLAELAAYLFSRSNSGDQPDAVGARAGRAFFGEPRPDPRVAGDPRGHAHRRAAGEVGHLSDDAGRRASRRWRCSPRPACRSIPIQIYETVELRKIHEIKAAELACSRATEENYERLREILKASEERLAAGAGAGARGPRFPSGDRARHAEQRLPQDLQRLLRDGRASAAGLFQRSRARPPVACRASADLRCAAAPRRQSGAGADERASAGRRELLEGPDRRARQRGSRARRSKRPERHVPVIYSTHRLHPRAAEMLADGRRAQDRHGARRRDAGERRPRGRRSSSCARPCRRSCSNAHRNCARRSGTAPAST